MAQMTQQYVLKMEISDIWVSSQHMVVRGKERISLVELGPSRGLMSAGV
jgi:hypothetical protein